MHYNTDAINNLHLSSENVPSDINQSILGNELADSVSQLREIKPKNPCSPSFAYINFNSVRNKHSELFRLLTQIFIS